MPATPRHGDVEPIHSTTSMTRCTDRDYRGTHDAIVQDVLAGRREPYPFGFLSEHSLDGTGALAASLPRDRLRSSTGGEWISG